MEGLGDVMSRVLFPQANSTVAFSSRQHYQCSFQGVKTGASKVAKAWKWGLKGALNQKTNLALTFTPDLRKHSCNLSVAQRSVVSLTGCMQFYFILFSPVELKPHSGGMWNLIVFCWCWSHIERIFCFRIRFSEI